MSYITSSIPSACGRGDDAEAWLQSAAGRLTQEIERLTKDIEREANADAAKAAAVANKEAEKAAKAKAEKAEAERLRAFSKTSAFQSALRNKLAMAELVVKEASAQVAWFEGRINGLRNEAADIEAKILQRETDILSSKFVVDSFPFREAEANRLYETTTFRELAEEQKRLDAKIAAARAQHQDELNLLAKEREVAVSQLQKLRSEPPPRNSAQEILSCTTMHDNSPSSAVYPIGYTGEMPTNSIIGWLSYYKERAEPAKKVIEDIKIAMATLS